MAEMGLDTKGPGETNSASIAAEGRFAISVLMKSAPPLRIDGPREDDLRLLPVKLRLKVLRWLLCIILSTGVPDRAWGQYSSGGYSRPGGGSTPTTRRRAVGRQSAAAAGTVGDRIPVPAMRPARPEIGLFPAAYRRRRCATIRRRSGPQRHTPAGRPLMPAAPTGRAKRRAGHRSGEGSSRQQGWREDRRCRVRDR